jgi:hypothetical protein
LADDDLKPTLASHFQPGAKLNATTHGVFAKPLLEQREDYIFSVRILYINAQGLDFDLYCCHKRHF